MTDLRQLPALAALAMATLSACAFEAPAPEAAREIARYTIEDFLDTTNYFGGSFSPDKSKVLVSSNETGIYNAYAIPTDGGDPIALTRSTGDSVRVVGYFPADERFLFLQDSGGNELNHLFVRELDGAVTDLTPGEGHRRCSTAGPGTTNRSSSEPTSVTSASSTSTSTRPTATLASSSTRTTRGWTSRAARPTSVCWRSRRSTRPATRMSTCTTSPAVSSSSSPSTRTRSPTAFSRSAPTARVST